MEKIFQLYMFVSYINTIFVLYTNKVWGTERNVY